MKYCETKEGIDEYDLSGSSSGLRFIYSLGRHRICGNCEEKDNCCYGLPCKERKNGKGHEFHGECGDYDCRYCSLYFDFSGIGKLK